MPAKTAVAASPAASEEAKPKRRISGKLRKRVNEQRRRLTAMHLACRRDNTVVQLIPKSVAKRMITSVMEAHPEYHVDRITHESRDAVREAILAVTRRLCSGVHLTTQLSGNKRTSAADVAVAARLLGLSGTEDMIRRKSIAMAMGELDELIKPAEQQ